MSMDSRSRSRSPLGDDDEGSPRSRRSDRWKYEKSSRSSSNTGSSNNRIYVSNIPYEYKWQDLKDVFRREVGNIAFVEMFEDDNQRPRGSAVVEFDSVDLAQKAVDKMHLYEIKGRKLVVKEKCDAMNSRDFQFLFNPNSDRDRGGSSRYNRDMDRRLNNYDRSSFSDHHQMNDQQIFGNTYGLSIPFLKSLHITGPLVSKIFVANLDYKVTEEEVSEVFKVAGNVLNCEMLKTPEGKSRGFAIVEYEHPIQAVQAISMLHNQKYYDRVINVRMDRVADSKAKKLESSSRLPPGLKSLGMGLGSNGSAITDIANIPTQSNIPTPQNFGVGNMSNNVTGMPNMGNPMVGGGSGFDIMGGGGNVANNMRPNINPAITMLGMGGLEQLNNAISNTMGMNMGGSGNPGVVMSGNNMPPNMGGANLGNNMHSGNMGNNMGGGGGGLPNPNMMSGGGATNFSNNMNDFGGNRDGTSNGSSRIYSSSSSNSERRGSNNYSSSTSSRTIVQVSNLPSDYTWQSLKDLCRNYGHIKFAEIRTKGTGLVRFATESEARKTADVLDRQRFDGRFLDAQVL